jgi:hypothetical protein
MSALDHPAFPQPSSTDVALWRYMDETKFVWLAENKRLFMPAALNLGDRFEGSTPQAELDWWAAEAVKSENEAFRNTILANRQLLSRWAAAYANKSYVSCWHMNRHENNGMWRFYTQGPRAVAIQTTFDRLRGCLPSYVMVGLVRYLNYVTDRLPTMNMFQGIMHKRVQFAFEQEVRAVAVPPLMPPEDDAHFRENLFELASTPGFVVYAPAIDPVRLVQAVVLHPEAPADFAQSVGEICANLGLPAPRTSEMRGEPKY